jgi:acyl-CoA thioesterase FadM
VVASSTIEFAQEMQYPDPLLVSVGLIDVGRTSYRVAQVARQNGRVGAYAEIVQVASDGARSVPFDDEWRAQLERLKLVDPSPENGD